MNYSYLTPPYMHWASRVYFNIYIQRPHFSVGSFVKIFGEGVKNTVVYIFSSTIFVNIF